MQAVIVVDYQNDFANPEKWSLYVRWWEKIAPAINQTMREVKSRWWIVLASKELHPAWHISFASNFLWKESITEAFKRWENPGPKNFITKDEIKNWDEKNNWLSPNAWFSLKELKAYIETNWDQALWPNHCEEWKFWSEYYKDLDTSLIDIEVKKWFKSNSHPYSAFWWYSLDEKLTTLEILKKAWVKILKIVWLATDYCDLATAIDWKENWFDVEFLTWASAWVDPAWTIDALKRMRESWVIILP